MGPTWVLLVPGGSHVGPINLAIRDNFIGNAGDIKHRIAHENCTCGIIVKSLRVQRVESPLWWHHNGRDGISNHQPHDCLLNRRLKKTSKLYITGFWAGNSPVTGEFPAQMASNMENVSIRWHHDTHLSQPLLLQFLLKLGISPEEIHKDSE